MFEFLQIDTIGQVASKAVAGDTNNDGYTSFYELIILGGWIMIPLGIMLLLVIYFFAERYITISNASKIEANFMNIIRDHITNGNVTAAKSFAKNVNNPVARVIDKGIQRIGKPIDGIEKSMENVAVLEMYRLEKNLGFLSVITKAAPIFGFVGTLVGMMQLFSGINSSPDFNTSSIAGGIYTKLITSITGLLIGMLSFLAYSYLSTQIDKSAHKIEAASSDFLDILQEPTR